MITSKRYFQRFGLIRIIIGHLGNQKKAITVVSHWPVIKIIVLFSSSIKVQDIPSNATCNEITKWIISISIFNHLLMFMKRYTQKLHTLIIIAPEEKKVMLL